MASYYRPYLPSDSELSDADSELSYISPPDSPLQRPENAEEDLGGPDFSALAAALSASPLDLQEAAGPSFVTTMQEDTYGENRLDSRTSYSAYVLTDLSGQKMQTTTTEVPTIIMLQSRDRDKTVFTQPTNCKLFLPRIYKNIKGFSIVQLNLTSAFFYFRNNKRNLDITIQEEGRTTYLANSTFAPTDSKIPLKLTNNIREGSYTISQLLTELNTQLNKTPIFYDFINGFTDFISVFSVNGDYSLNFNEPGDNYYDAVRKVYIDKPTREVITSFYFQTRYALQYAFTIQQAKNAYYYPVIKEVLLDPEENLSAYNFTYLEMNADDVKQYLTFSFTGLDDPIATTVINANIALLDVYRLYHTFRYSLVNKYVCTYETKNNRVNINTATLNTSLSNTLITQYNSYLDQQLMSKGITRTQYNALSTDIIASLSIIQGMYDYMQSNFARYFAVDYGTYGREYFINSTNSIFLRPGLDALGVALAYTSGTTINPQKTDILNGYKTPPPVFWPYMKNLSYSPIGAQINMGSSRQTFPTSSNHPYILASSNMDITRDFINDQGIIYTDYRRKVGDILVNVEAGKYTIFKFRSPVRQSLQIESLPRQMRFRYPIWNKNNPESDNPPYNPEVKYPVDQIFDISYSFVDPSGVLLTNLRMIPYKPVYGWSTITGLGKDNIWNYSTNFSATFSQSAAFWGVNSETLNSTQPNGNYYRFIAPYPTDPVSKGSNVYTYNYSVTIESADGAFPVDFHAYFYHDEAIFNADMNYQGGRNENPYNYKFKLIIPANTRTATHTFKAYAGQNYYMIFRSSTTTSPSIKYRVIPYCPDGTVKATLINTYKFEPLTDPMTMLNNFAVAKNADPDFIRLPVSTMATDNTGDPNTVGINIPLNTVKTAIGYDLSGVSTDLTDYIPFNTPYNSSIPILPSATSRVDPLTDYVFQYNTPYDLTQNSYFTSNTKNYLFTKGAENEYTHNTVDHRQYKIVQYYATHYLRDAADISYPQTDISPYVKVYDANTTNGPLVGYQYNSAANQYALKLGTGVCGFTFLPDDGSWNIERITIKTNFVNESKQNSKVHCLGIFLSSEIDSLPTSYIKLKNAVAICLRVQDKPYTQNNQNLGFDAGLGTYHTFSNYPAVVIRTGFNILGFSQAGKQFINDINAYYSAVAFTFTDIETWNTSNIDINAIKTSIANTATQVVPIQNMVGTPIPYPFAGTASASAVFYDGYTTPTGKYLVVSSPISNGHPYGPDPNLAIDESVCQYEKSIPMVNSHMHYLTPQNIISDSNGFSAWTGLPSSPDYIHASVLNTNATPTVYVNPSNRKDTYSYIDGYALIQSAVFSIVKYKVYTTVSQYTQMDREFVFKGHITTQQIFPDSENTSIIGVSGTTSHFIFLGASNIVGSTTTQLRFKKYDPIQGILTELPMHLIYTFDSSYTLQNFVFNNSDNWFYTASIANEPIPTIVLRGTTKYGSEVQTENISYSYPNVTKSELQMDPSSQNLYMSLFNDPGFSNMNIFSLNPANSLTYIGITSVGTIVHLDLTPLNSNYPYYQQFSVSNNNGNEEVLFLNNDYDSRLYFKLRNYITNSQSNTSNTNIDFSTQYFKNPSGDYIAMKRLIGGANGSKWALSDSYPFILGNRNDSYDAPTSLDVAWQIFFPVVKIQLEKISSGKSPILDLTELNDPLGSESNVKYPEWPHTVMFAYSNFTSLSNDILNEGGKWGLESKFLVSDVGFQGFNFNSYLVNIPLQSNVGKDITDSNEYSYVAVRGYTPTESFQTMLRFYLPNRYDFGFVRLMDIATEIPIAIGSACNFNPLYRDTLLQFNSNFVFTGKNFGSNAYQGLSGSNITSISFGDYLQQYKSYYDTFVTKSQNLESINSNVKLSINAFINSNLQFILPPAALTRQRFTDPLLSKILWKESLDPIYTTYDDEWGLGWNLGYAKADSIAYSTTHAGESFYKINQDYIYLRLNPEFNINGMDAGGKEDYRTSRESSGTTNQYYCKLLLTGFGSNATTFIHNPINFNPPINRLTTLHFQWIDSKGVIIDNADCEWDMTVNLREAHDIQTIPNKMDFKVADPKTGLPALLPAGFQAPNAQEQGDYAKKKEDEELEGEKLAMREAAAKARAAESIRTKK